MWRDVIGQELRIEELKSYLKSGKMPHAFLFAGPEGLGKTRAAKELFKAINCLATPGDPCDACKTCLKAMRDAHPDFHLIEPANGWIVVEDIRDIIAETGLKPFDARMRVIVIKPAERMNKASANALLKTLEEPPEGTLIILVSHKPSLLLPTIVSRCQVIRFTPVDASAATGTGLDPVLLRLSSGTLGGLAAGGAETVLEIRSQILDVLRGGDPVQAANKYFSEQEQGSDTLQIFLLLVESMLRDLLVLAHGCGHIINEEFRTMDLRRIRHSDAEDLAQCLHAIRRGAGENVNLRYAVSELLIRMKSLV